MGAFVGPMGGLVEVSKYYTPTTIAPESRFGAESTLGGKRIVQVSPASPRTWSVSIDHADAAELSPLLLMAGGAAGNGPFWWVDAPAQFTNIMSRRMSLVREAGWIEAYAGRLSLGGMMRAVSGEMVGPVVYNSDPAAVIPFILDRDSVPVIASKSVTLAAFVSAGGYLRTGFLDAAGVRIDSSTLSSTPASGTGLHRVHSSRVVPDGAVSAWLEVRGASMAAGPTVTWTDRVMPYSPGFGADRVIIEENSTEPYLASSEHSYFKASFTVMEVGRA